MVAITSDKGLCGGINTTVSKYTRGTLNTCREGARPQSAQLRLLLSASHACA